MKKNFELNLDEHNNKMNTIERGATANEKDIQNRDDDVEIGRGDGSRVPAQGE
jgi:hypothetical protein